MAKRLWTTSALAVAIALLVSACGSSTTSTAPSAAPPSAAPSAEASASTAPRAEPSAPPAAAVPTVPTGYTELDAAMGADKPFDGKTVSIQTQWIGGEGENFAAGSRASRRRHGHRRPGRQHRVQPRDGAQTRIEGGAPPISRCSRSRRASSRTASGGKLIDVRDLHGRHEAHRRASGHDQPGGAEPTSIWGIPYKVDVKSTVWYPIKAFGRPGYDGPDDRGRS